MERHCSACGKFINQEKTGEPFLPYKNIDLCSFCYIDLIEKIYQMAGKGDGGIIHILFNQQASSNHGRKKRKSIAGYNRIFNKLLHKYKFKCVRCEEKEQLTIDHVIPVSKGGSDCFNNLQILCKSCNSKKGAKYEMV